MYLDRAIGIAFNLQLNGGQLIAEGGKRGREFPALTDLVQSGFSLTWNIQARLGCLHIAYSIL
jgi:hypothetical protein